MFPLSLTTEDAINLGLFAVGILTLAVGVYYNYVTRQQSLKTERASAYLALEMHSSEVFKFEADNCVSLEPYRSVSRPGSLPAGAAATKAEGVAENLYFQTLNLFEVCTRFRKNQVIDEEVFATWVAWFYDTLDDWYFRERWRAGMRENYTADLQAIFDEGLAIFHRFGEAEEPGIDDERRRAFYAAVADQLDCDRIREWLGPPPAKAKVQAPSFALGWAQGAPEREEAAVFLARTIGTEPAYISHGEIQSGLSADGRRWIADLESRLIADLTDLDADRGLVVARADGEIVGTAIVHWLGGGRIRFGVIEDLAVAAAFRSQGIGGELVDEIEAEARRRELTWLFLESGLENRRAHGFFEARSYIPVSKVFGKRLSPPMESA